MNSVVLDASAVLAVLLGESGEDVVEPKLPNALVSALNYSEILARTVQLCGSLEEAKRRIDRHDLMIIAFDADHAAVAVSLIPATKSRGLSLADRACLALGLIRNLPVYTADRQWRELDIGVKIEFIR